MVQFVPAKSGYRALVRNMEPDQDCGQGGTGASCTGRSPRVTATLGVNPKLMHSARVKDTSTKTRSHMRIYRLAHLPMLRAFLSIGNWFLTREQTCRFVTFPY